MAEAHFEHGVVPNRLVLCFVCPHAGCGAGLLGDISNMAPEVLSSKGVLGRNADTWALGLMATRALTEYFPFDDVLSAFLVHAIDSIHLNCTWQ